MEWKRSKLALLRFKSREAAPAQDPLSACAQPRRSYQTRMLRFDSEEGWKRCAVKQEPAALPTEKLGWNCGASNGTRQDAANRREPLAVA